MARDPLSQTISKQEVLVDLEGLEEKSSDACSIDRCLGGVRRGQSVKEN